MDENKRKLNIISMLVFLIILAIGGSVIFPIWGMFGVFKYLCIVLCTSVLIQMVISIYMTANYESKWTKEITIQYIVIGILIIIAYGLAFSF